MTDAVHLSCGVAHGWVQDKTLRLAGRAELPLCPELLGGAAAPPYRRREDSCHAPPPWVKRFEKEDIHSNKQSPRKRDRSQWAKSQLVLRCVALALSFEPTAERTLFLEPEWGARAAKRRGQR